MCMHVCMCARVRAYVCMQWGAHDTLRKVSSLHAAIAIVDLVGATAACSALGCM